MIRITLANLEAVGLICSDILFKLSFYNWTYKENMFQVVNTILFFSATDVSNY